MSEGKGSDDDDEDGDDCAFIPSKIDLQSSSDEEEVEAKVESEDELVVSRKTRRVSGARTPQPAEKTWALTRTPRKTPSKKVRHRTRAQRLLTL